MRGFFNLTDNPDSVMVLREDRDDPATETRIPLPAGAQVIIDTQRLWHAVWHPGTEPRYCLITSWESGPELGRLHPEAAPADHEARRRARSAISRGGLCQVADRARTGPRPALTPTVGSPNLRRTSQVRSLTARLIGADCAQRDGPVGYLGPRGARPAT